MQKDVYVHQVFRSLKLNKLLVLLIHSLTLGILTMETPAVEAFGRTVFFWASEASPPLIRSMEIELHMNT